MVQQLSSYGGKLRATRRYLVRPGTKETSTEDIDVILVGNNGISLYWIYGISAGQEVVRANFKNFLRDIRN